MKRLLIALSVVGFAGLGLAGCQTTQTKPAEPTAAKPAQTAPAQPMTQSVAQAPAKEPSPIKDVTSEVTFLDMSGFDDDLSADLSEQNKNIKVAIPAKFSLNNIPDRLEKWLAAVKESGGKVQAKTEPKPGMATRGILGALIDITVSAVKAKEEADKLATAENYNVLMTYDEQTGEVQNVLFYHR